MERDLFNLIEADCLTAQFDLFGDGRSLYRWIADHLYTRALLAIAEGDPAVASAVAARALSLFDAPAPTGYRTDHEAAICFYAVILSRLEHLDTRRALDELDANATRVYGWLDTILAFALRDASTNSWAGARDSWRLQPTAASDSSTSLDGSPYSSSASFEVVNERFANQPLMLSASE